MANAPLSPEVDQDEAFNKGQQDYTDRLSSIKNAEQSGDTSTEPGSVRGAEEGIDSSQNTMNYTGSGGGQKKKSTAVIAFAKKRGGLIGLIAALGLGGGLLATLFGPYSMVINLMENISVKNDSSSTAMERRFIKVFGNMTNPDNDAICANTTKNIKCRMGRISNAALKSLHKKGVTAVMADGNEYDGKTKKGYPDKNPVAYIFTNDDGSKKPVDAKALPEFLAAKENRKLAAKILGTKGAFNLRVKAWTGKHISKKLYKPFSIDRNGGLADGKNEPGRTVAQRVADSLAKMKDKLPGTKSAETVRADIEKKADGHLGKAQKGGAAYITAVSTCIAIRAPGYIAAGVAAVQLAQVMPFFTEYIGGPGSKAKQSAIGSGFAAEDMDAVGSVLTEKVDGKSALDSPVLLAAAGINTGRAAVPEKVTPGYSTLKTLAGARAVEKESEAACNAVMSPTAMYTAMAADIAVTVGLSATVIGGVIKVGASLVVSTVAAEVAKIVLSDAATAAITDIAENDAIPEARGEELGDVLGVSASAFFATGGLSRHLPVLTESDLTAFTTMKDESIAFQRDMDIASLSPFDISSQYTFLGSILHTTRTATLGNSTGSHISTALSSFGNLVMRSFTSPAQAFTESYGGYAADFGLETDDPSTTPCITVSGLPCTGITANQAAISTESAINAMINEGWVSEEITAAEGATTDELIGSGIQKDTPLSEFIETCSNPASGDYLYSAAGCTVQKTSADYASVTGQGGAFEAINSIEGLSATAKGPTNVSSLEAMTPFLLDYQIIQSVNGEDEEEGTSAATGTGDYMSDDFIVYNQCGGTASGEIDWNLGAISPISCTAICVTASTAIIVANMADSSVTPAEIWNYAKAHTTNGGSNPDNFAESVASAYGLKAERVGSINTLDQYKAIFDKGGMILLLGQGTTPFISSGHAVVARGITADGKIRISNPSRYSYAQYGIEGKPATVDIEFDKLMANSTIMEPTWAFYK